MAEYDLFVIGGGSGGIACARRAASYGARVALAEAGRLGGTCVVRGCVPKKLTWFAAQLRRALFLAPGYGWRTGEIGFDFAALLSARDREVARLQGVYRRLLREAGVHLYEARARIVAGGPPHVVEVAGERVRARRVVVAVGGRPSLPDLPGIEHAVTSDWVFEGHYPLPRELAVVGAGYIGVEVASIFRALGSRVRLVYRRELPLRGFDLELRKELASALEREGVDLLPGTRIERLERAGQRLRLVTSMGELEADLVVYATGRHPVPNTRGLGLEELGVRMNREGAIYVDIGYESNVPGIHAVGDCSDHAGHGLDASQHDLTPVAIAEGRALAERLFHDNPELVAYETVPTAVFGIPQVASVGYSEERARELGLDVVVFTTAFRPMLYTLPDLPARTFMKLVVDRASDRVLGCHMIGDDAAEIVQGLAVALTAGAKKADFDATVGIHPTAAEEFVTMYKPRV
ncbi:Glutathione amide reductase [bacterium HR40]|nr:Glutathione amide reductase [bacterium HR40]